MDLHEAARLRHSVRQYSGKRIEGNVLKLLREEIDRINSESGLTLELVLDEPKAFSGMFISTYGQFSGVKNYLVVAAPKGKDWEEKAGYYGEELVILAQSLDLNTCWAGLTYKKIPGTFTLRAGDTVHCFIALGYGATPGVQHPQKPMEHFYESDGLPPEWFRKGMEAALLAPTAVNQQKFKFILHSGSVVETRTFFSPWGYTHIDLGIVKYHFEVGAGKENFSWK